MGYSYLLGIKPPIYQAISHALAKCNDDVGVSPLGVSYSPN
jgi:hypothetical protein